MIECEKCGLYREDLCQDEKNCPARPSSCTVDSLVRAGYTAQGIWHEEGAEWFDIGKDGLFDTREDAENYLDGCLAHYAPREGVRTLKATRIVHRRIVNTVVRPNNSIPDTAATERQNTKGD